MGDLLDDSETTEEVGDNRRAKEGEVIDRLDKNWVRDYEKMMNPEELEKSRSIRRKFSQKFTEFPYSIMDDINKRDERRTQLDSIVRDEAAHKAYEDTWSVRSSANNPAISQFPSKLAQNVIRMWSMQNDKIFDPFMGHFSRPILSNHFGRDYWGCDVSEAYFTETKKEIKSRIQGGLLDDKVLKDEEGLLEADWDDNWLRMEKRDSRHLLSEEPTIQTEWADFILTSPPYWDLENYGDEDEQLGKDNSKFDEFMEDMKEIMSQCYDILKPHRYAAFVVNDFRKDSMVTGLTPYHSDMIQAGEEVGFNFHDLAQYKTGKSAGLFTQQLAHMEITAKIHDFVLVFRKEPEDMKKWKPRGIHLDTYPRDIIVDYYSEDYLEWWLEQRRERGLPTEEWEE